jgi:hypothetical protein
MSNHLGDTNKMVSETPRMDSAGGHARGIVDAAILAEGIKLERELNAANDRIKRLEEALAWYEYTVLNCYCHGSEGDAARDALRKDQGRKAKEAKP